MKKLLTFILVLLVFWGHTQTTYYVSTSGDDSNNGTSTSTPWKTLNKLEVETFNSGDSILFKRGDEWKGEQFRPGWSGTEENRIVIDAYGTGDKPIWSAAERITDWTAHPTKSNVWVTPCPLTGHDGESYRKVVEIDGDRFFPIQYFADLDADLEYVNINNTGTSTDSLYVYSATDPAARNTLVSTVSYAIRDGRTPDPASTYVTVRNIDFKYFGYAGIDLRNNFGEADCYWIIEYCDFYFCKNDGLQFLDGHNSNIARNNTVDFCGNGLYVNGADSSSFIGNTITNTVSYMSSGGYGFTDGHGIGMWNCSNILVEGNTLNTNTDSMGVDGGAIIGIDRGMGTIRNNKISGNRSCIGVHRTNPNDTLYIYYNELVNVLSTPILIDTIFDTSEIHYFNNTVVSPAGGGSIRLLHKTDNAVFKNNVFYAGTANYLLTIYDYEVNWEIDYNLWRRNLYFAWLETDPSSKDDNLAEWQVRTSQDANSIEGEPLFTDFANGDYSLLSTSPAINTGVDVGLTTDINGNPIIGTPDMGAYEFQPSTYYVSNTGTGDTLNTIAEVNALNLTPGDSVLFKRGDEWRGETLVIGWSGTEENRIIIGAYGSGDKPIFNGSQVITDWTAHPTRSNVWVTPSPLILGDLNAVRTVVVIDDDRFMPVLWESLDADLEYYPLNNAGTENDSVYVYSVADPSTRTTELSVVLNGIQDGWGVTDSANQYITIKNIYFKYFGYEGVELRSNVHGDSIRGYCIVDSCEFYFNKQGAVQFYNGHEYNTVSNCIVNYCGNGLYSNNSNYNHFYGNTITNSIEFSQGVVSPSFTDGHAIGVWDSKGAIVEDNYLEGYPFSGHIIGCDRGAGTFRYNEIHGYAKSGGGGHRTYEDEDIYYYYNVFYDHEYGAGVCFWMDSLLGDSKWYLYNNTFVSKSTTGNRAVRIQDTENNNMVIKNNIFVTEGVNYAIEERKSNLGFESDYNLFDVSGYYVYWESLEGVGSHATTFEAWQATGNGTNSVDGDPMFTDSDNGDFTLQTGSPAINAGVDLGLPNRDINGNWIVGLPDLGAYEYQNPYTPVLPSLTYTQIERNYVVKHMSNKDVVFSSTSGKYFVGHSVISQGDSLFYFGANGDFPLDSLNTKVLPSNSAMLIERESVIDTLTISQDSLWIGSWTVQGETGYMPTINVVSWDTIAYPTVIINALNIGRYNYD